MGLFQVSRTLGSHSAAPQEMNLDELHSLTKLKNPSANCGVVTPKIINNAFFEWSSLWQIFWHISCYLLWHVYTVWAFFSHVFWPSIQSIFSHFIWHSTLRALKHCNLYLQALILVKDRFIGLLIDHDMIDHRSVFQSSSPGFSPMHTRPQSG